MWEDELDPWREFRAASDAFDGVEEVPSVSLAFQIRASAGFGKSAVLVQAEHTPSRDTIYLMIESEGIEDELQETHPGIPRVAVLHLSDPRLLHSIGRALIAIAPHVVEQAKRRGEAELR